MIKFAEHPFEKLADILVQNARSLSWLRSWRLRSNPNSLAKSESRLIDYGHSTRSYSSGRSRLWLLEAIFKQTTKSVNSSLLFLTLMQKDRTLYDLNLRRKLQFEGDDSSSNQQHSGILDEINGKRLTLFLVVPMR
ncbi:hypothetical protein SUGI_0188190 [Cryptomeria japonica]|nr:hypothetical protein SUGI_0188190 [Cryptomeria japonica]